MVARSILLVRHAVAVDRHPSGDECRPLSAAGRSAFRRHVKKLSRKLRLSRLVTSPLVRAVQTAELLALAFDVEEVEVDPLLAPGADLELFIKSVRAAPSGTAFVGHNPSLTLAAQSLLSQETLPFRFKKGGALWLDLASEAPFQGFWKP